MRYEFIAIGTVALLERLSEETENEVLQTQMDVFLSSMENDEEEVAAKLDRDIIDWSNALDIGSAMDKTFKGTSAYPMYLAILKHIALIPSNPFTR